VPNSLVQGLTTRTRADLNGLPPFTMTTLLGLVSLVDPKHPEREVCARPADVLEVIGVGREVAHTVGRAWATRDGGRQVRRYQAKRHHPEQQRRIHKALLELHSCKVVVRGRGPAGDGQHAERVVHLLDAFGYTHEDSGRPVDVDDLPADRRKVNVGTRERPVWRVQRHTARGDEDVRPSGILFRLNTELAA
jgi:hypothetical protein